MIFSLPNYRRLSEADLARLRKDDKRTVSRYVANTLFNLLLLAALWGLPYYFCSLVLSRESNSTKSRESNSTNPREAIIGVWWPVDRGAIEFTRDGKFRLWQGGIVTLTAHYGFDHHGDIVLYNLNPPAVIDHKEAADAQFRFTVTFTGDDTVTITGGWSENKHSRLSLPGSHFKRVK